MGKAIIIHRGKVKRDGPGVTVAAGIFLLVSTVLYCTRPRSFPTDDSNDEIMGEQRHPAWWGSRGRTTIGIDQTDIDQERGQPVATDISQVEDTAGGARSRGRSRGKKRSSSGRSGLAGPAQNASEHGEDATEAANEEDFKRHGKYYTCPQLQNTSMPTLEGLELHLTKGMTWEDVFITQKNHMRLLHKEFAINRHSVQWLPDTAEALLTNYRWRSCAAVGNSGSLKFAEFGDVINTHDLVLRSNQAPTFGYEKHVGSKTSFRILNKLWTTTYAAAKFQSLALPLERGVSLVLTRSTGKEFDQLAKYLQGYRQDVAVLYLSSRMVTMVRQLLVAYRARLCTSGRGPYDGGSVPSSGLVATLILMQLCQHVTIYGYGHDHPPASLERPNAQEASYHYFSGLGARKSGVPVHSWHTEEMLLHQLAKEGRIRFCRPDFRTNNAAAARNNIACGLNPTIDKAARAHWLQRRAGRNQSASVLPPHTNLRIGHRHGTS